MNQNIKWVRFSCTLIIIKVGLDCEMQFKPKKKKKPFDKWYLPHAMGNFNLMTKLLTSCNLSM